MTYRRKADPNAVRLYDTLKRKIEQPDFGVAGERKGVFLRYLREEGAATAAELHELTGMKSTSITATNRLITNLIHEGLVMKRRRKGGKHNDVEYYLPEDVG